MTVRPYYPSGSRGALSLDELLRAVSLQSALG